MHLRTLSRCAVLASLVVASSLPAADEGYEQEGRAGFGAFVVPPQLDDLAQRDLLPGDGAIVLHVRPGSTAESLGIQPGDVVRSINDRPIQSFRDVRAFMHTVAPGDQATVIVTGSDGVTRTLDGAFKARLPRRGGPPPWAMNGGGTPPWMMSADEIITDQRQQLLDEQQRLAGIAADLDAARNALGSTANVAWSCIIAVDFGVSEQE